MGKLKKVPNHQPVPNLWRNKYVPTHQPDMFDMYFDFTNFTNESSVVSSDVLSTDNFQIVHRVYGAVSCLQCVAPHCCGHEMISDNRHPTAGQVSTPAVGMFPRLVSVCRDSIGMNIFTKLKIISDYHPRNDEQTRPCCTMLYTPSVDGWMSQHIPHGQGTYPKSSSRSSIAQAPGSWLWIRGT